METLLCYPAKPTRIGGNYDRTIVIHTPRFVKGFTKNVFTGVVDGHLWKAMLFIAYWIAIGRFF